MIRQVRSEHDAAIRLCEQVVAVYVEQDGAEADRADPLNTLACSLDATGRRGLADVCRAAGLCVNPGPAALLMAAAGSPGL
ncbi:hypothetical protein [Saccharothrix sp. Mg75]|uniref:hypothetical protein n=1 Tax=Saccharothrix sp. Mg75 TaxID=3445357 RepID=UPI003EEEA5A2